MLDILLMEAETILLVDGHGQRVSFSIQNRKAEGLLRKTAFDLEKWRKKYDSVSYTVYSRAVASVLESQSSCSSFSQDRKERSSIQYRSLMWQISGFKCMSHVSLRVCRDLRL